MKVRTLSVTKTVTRRKSCRLQKAATLSSMKRVPHSTFCSNIQPTLERSPHPSYKSYFR